VLGSGFGGALRERFDGVTVAYKKIEGMPQPGVAGHAGEAHIGTLHGRRVAVFSGRFHLYEGRAVAEVVYPILAAAYAGAGTFVLTNAAGGLNPAFRAGDLMLIADQLNLTGASPLMGADPMPGARARFTDMADAYAPPLRRLARHMAGEYGIDRREGVYAGLPGPAYETPAEARYLRTIGADALAVLQSHDWPGNVRQLRNNIERLMILAGGDPEAVINADMLPQDVGSMVPSMPGGDGGGRLMGVPLRDAREVFEREYLVAQISRFGGNISRTAEFIGMERSALHRKLKSLSID